jgi:CHAT domain-containing protein
LHLSASLVVLSACHSGEGQSEPGEGVLGFPWALFIAGAPGSIVSQWQVASDSTTRLMETFYEIVHPDGGKDPSSYAEALRQAQLGLLHSNGRYAHPFYWAAFFLNGDWRNQDETRARPRALNP